MNAVVILGRIKGGYLIPQSAQSVCVRHIRAVQDEVIIMLRGKPRDMRAFIVSSGGISSVYCRQRNRIIRTSLPLFSGVLPECVVRHLRWVCGLEVSSTLWLSDHTAMKGVSTPEDARDLLMKLPVSGYIQKKDVAHRGLRKGVFEGIYAYESQVMKRSIARQGRPLQSVAEAVKGIKPRKNNRSRDFKRRREVAKV